MSTSGPFEAYFDFDNTITNFDVLDSIVEHFSINEEWKQVEGEWLEGKISSRQCLERQFSQVRVTEAQLTEYLMTIEVDPAFRPILALLRSRDIEPVILSDSFKSVISAILDNNDIQGIQIFSNEMRIEGNIPILSFPYFHSICTICGNCKTSHLMRRDRAPNTRKIYAGDGKSDVCPAGFCEILFAKGSLLKHFSTLRRDCRPFENLTSVLCDLQAILQ